MISDYRSRNDASWAIKAACLISMLCAGARVPFAREGNVVVLEDAHGDVIPTPRATVLPVRVG